MKHVSRLLVLAGALLSTSAWAVKIPVGTDSALNFSLLAQPTAQFADGSSPSGKLNTDFFVRRARLNVTGNFTRYVAFQLQADQASLFKGGEKASSLIWQDANVTLIPIAGVFIDAGFFTQPLSRSSLQAAGAHHTLDLWSALGNTAGVIRYNNADRALRETGVQLRVVSPDNKFNGRVAVLEGVRGGTGPLAPGSTTKVANPDGLPKVAGYLQYDLLGEEGGFAFNGIYFSPKPIVAVGVGGQYQAKSVTPTVTGADFSDYVVGAASIFFELPASADLELVGNADYYKYWEGANAPNNGYGVNGVLGVRYDMVEPIVSIQYFNGDAHTVDFRRMSGGVNLWLNKHGLNIKGEIAREVTGNLPTATSVDFPTGSNIKPQASSARYLGTVQLQMAFQ